MKDILQKIDIKKYGLIKLKKDQILFHEFDICNEVYLLIDGKIKISSSDINGKEDVFNELKSGDMFANILVFASDNRFLGDAIALMDSKILKINKNELIDLLQSNLDFLMWFLSYNSNETMESKLKTKLLSKRSIEERILYYISSNGGSLNTTITGLAKNIMVNRVCVSRVVSKMCNENILKKEGNKLIII